MNVKYLVLGKSKYKIRDIALKHYLANKDPKIAIEEAIKEIKTGSIIATILIGVAIQLIIQLINYWVNKRISRPSMFYSEGEPGN